MALLHGQGGAVDDGGVVLRDAEVEPAFQSNDCGCGVGARRGIKDRRVREVDDVEFGEGVGVWERVIEFGILILSDNVAGTDPQTVSGDASVVSGGQVTQSPRWMSLQLLDGIAATWSLAIEVVARTVPNEIGSHVIDSRADAHGRVRLEVAIAGLTSRLDVRWIGGHLGEGLIDGQLHRTDDRRITVAARPVYRFLALAEDCT